MADLVEKAAKQLGEITECSICMSAFKDPRMLPCIHTFCFECLKRTAEAGQKKPGDVMPCPLCRKDFIIPEDGMNGVQKHFFMENLLEFKTTLQIGNAITICDMCNVRNEGKTGDISKTTMRCVQCQDNYCDICVRVHQFQKLSRNHHFINIGGETASEVKRPFATIHCSKHILRTLDYYCADCKKIVCVSCFVESHASHKCKDVTTVDEEFRQTIRTNSSKISIYADEMLAIRKNADTRKADFLKQIVDKENAIHTRNQELKDMIDEHTKLLLDELSVIKSKHLKEMETGLQEIDRYNTIFRSFEAYCTELISKGSASDICSSVDQLIRRADELEKDHKAFIGRPHQSIEVCFQATDLREALQNSNNVLGEIKESTSQIEDFVIVVGISYSSIKVTSKDVLKINLHRPNEISTHGQIPISMMPEATAAVYCNTMYVSGLGVNRKQIWKYNLSSGWVKCASLVQGRRRHSAAFIDEVLYICGGVTGYVARFGVEAFNTVTDECKIVGKLVHCVQWSGNCVPFKSSLYIFGGKDKNDRDTSHIQVYNTKQNTCTLLTKPMPRPGYLMRAVLWETSAILVGQSTCFIFDFEEETWQEREQFKTGVRHFGLVLQNERVFVIGGGDSDSDKAVVKSWKPWECRDDVRYVPLRNILDDKPIEWKFHAQLPTPSLVYASGEMWTTV